MCNLALGVEGGEGVEEVSGVNPCVFVVECRGVSSTGCRGVARVESRGVEGMSRGVEGVSRVSRVCRGGGGVLQ